MKLAAVVSCLALLCGCAGGGAAPDNSRANTSHAPDVRQGDAGQKQWEPIFFREINGRIEGTGIKSLRDQEMPPRSREVRVWVGFGVAPLKGVILRQNGEDWSASYLPPSDSTSRAPLAARPLPAPKSGWQALHEKLEGLGIYTLPDAADIGAANTYPDAVGAVVEIKTPDLYRTYKYGGLQPTDKPEIKNVIEILTSLSDEFGVPLY